jgi:small subunit ribosomal protein S20
MANTSSAKKAARQAVKRTAVNKSRTTRMRNQVRKAEETIAAGDATAAAAAIVAAESALMKAAQNGTVHKNTAARKVSRLTARLKAAATA